MDELQLRFAQAVDDAFMTGVENVNFIAAETRGVAAGQLKIEVSDDPDAMKLETEWFLKNEFDRATVTILPTDEEREAMIEAHKEYIESLPESELRPENHKVDS